MESYFVNNIISWRNLWCSLQNWQIGLWCIWLLIMLYLFLFWLIRVLWLLLQSLLFRIIYRVICPFESHLSHSFVNCLGYEIELRKSHCLGCMLFCIALLQYTKTSNTLGDFQRWIYYPKGASSHKARIIAQSIELPI